MIGREIVILLIVAGAGLLAGRALRLPPIVSYLVAGLAAGPAGVGLLQRSEDLEALAEIGVALLLFGVGIEFSLAQLRQRIGRMLASGGAQIALTVAVTAGLFRTLDWDWLPAIFAGLLVSLSSTAIVFKLYDESGEIEAPQGQAAAGILLLQDLALVPMMLLIPVLANPEQRVPLAIAAALAQSAGALALVLVVARAVLPRALEAVARTRTPELFPLAALVAAFGTALLALRFGLSLPIGTFLAGLALSGSRYAHHVFAEVLPLRDAFVAIFFTSIGMLFDPATLISAPSLLAAMLAAVLAKGLIVAAIVRWLWRSPALALLTGLALCQIGEFAFVLANRGVSAGIFTEEASQALLGAAMLTMAATPFLIRFAHELASIGSERTLAARADELSGHVLIVGHGETGQAVARALRETGIRFTAIDLHPDNVARGRSEGIDVRFGDASRRAVLEAAGAATARAVVVTIGEPAATRRVVALVRQLHAAVPILVRARRVSEIRELERLGADEAVPSEFETSIELLVRLLDRLGIPRHIVRIQESLLRLGHYRALRGLGTTSELLAETRKLVAGGILETVYVMPGSPAAGKTLGELRLQQETGVVVLSVVRDETPLGPPSGSLRIEAEDLLVIFGPHAAIERALALFEASVDSGNRRPRASRSTASVAQRSALDE